VGRWRSEFVPPDRERYLQFLPDKKKGHQGIIPPTWLSTQKKSVKPMQINCKKIHHRSKRRFSAEKKKGARHAVVEA